MVDRKTAATHAAWSLLGEEGEEVRKAIEAARLGGGSDESLPEGVIEVAPGVLGFTAEAAQERDRVAMEEAARQRREGLGNLARVARLLRGRGAERK